MSLFDSESTEAKMQVYDAALAHREVVVFSFVVRQFICSIRNFGY
jgi:hypothetical protein